MACVLEKINWTTLLLALTAIGSIGLLIFLIYKHVTDKGKLKVELYLNENYLHDNTYYYTVTNYGSKQMTVKFLKFQIKDSNECSSMEWFVPTVIDPFADYDEAKIHDQKLIGAIKADNLKHFWAKDSTGKPWPMKKSNLKKLKQQNDRYKKRYEKGRG